MSAVLATQPVATLDDFLADPLVAAELAAVLDRLMGDSYVPFAGSHYGDLRIKARERYDARREKLIGDDAARLILIAWREHRP